MKNETLASKMSSAIWHCSYLRKRENPDDCLSSRTGLEVPNQLCIIHDIHVDISYPAIAMSSYDMY
jgi:hypothetical protein